MNSREVFRTIHMVIAGIASGIFLGGLHIRTPHNNSTRLVLFISFYGWGGGLRHFHSSRCWKNKRQEATLQNLAPESVRVAVTKFNLWKPRTSLGINDLRIQPWVIVLFSISLELGKWTWIWQSVLLRIGEWTLQGTLQGPGSKSSLRRGNPALSHS